MNRLGVGFFLLMSITASIASAAAGLGLRWTACFADLGTINRISACNANTGGTGQLLVGTFSLPSDLAGVTGLEGTVEAYSASATMPAWWSFFNAGSCRPTSLAATGVIPATSVDCTDWADANASNSLVAYQLGLLAPNMARIKIGSLLYSGTRDLVAGLEYFAFDLRIDNQKTVGTGACAGCFEPVCLWFRSLNVAVNGLSGVQLSGPENGFDANIAEWQATGSLDVRALCAPVAVRRSTWGAVKALYR